MKIATRTLALALAASLAAVAPAAHSRDGWRHHHHGRVHVGIGLGFGYYGPWYYPGYYYPGYVVGQPVLVAPAEPVAPLAPAPVIAPLHGQSSQQTEFDVQQCNRWAMTQPAAIADASEFHRTAMGCVQSRGYSVR